MTRNKRLGFLIPATNTTFEPETYAVIPAGVSAHFVRVPFVEVNEEQLHAMRPHTKRLAAHLHSTQIDVAAFACTTGSLIGGADYDRQIVNEIEAGGIENATTTSTAVINALNALGVTRIAIAAPYEAWLTELEVRFLESAGFSVIETASLGLRRHIADVGPAEVYELASQVARSAPEAVFISCTNIRTVDVLADLEADLGIPVISSNLATWWEIFRLARLSTGALRGTIMPLTLLQT